MKESSRYKGRHLHVAINYIMDGDKTCGGKYVSAVNCQPEYAYKQMIDTKKHFGKTDKRQGYHIIISFEEGEIDADRAFELVGRFVDEYLGGEYEVVYAVHTDTEHIHGHIVFNSVSFLTGRKYRYEKGDWAKYIQPITNRLCEEYGLSTIQIEGDGTKSNEVYKEWNDYRDGRFIWSDMIRRDVDACIIQAESYDDFLKLLSEKGYEIKQNKYLAIKPKGMSRFRRCKTLGENYTDERIRARIADSILEPIHYYEETEPHIIKVKIPYHIKRAKLTGIQKKYYARLYRLGVIKQRPYSKAWMYRNEIRKMHRLQEEYLFLADREIHDIDSLHSTLDVLMEEKKEVSSTRSKFYKERNRYSKLFAVSEEMKQLLPAYESYLNGDSYFIEEYERYMLLQNELATQGYTPEEIEKLREHYRGRASEINKDAQKVSKELRICRRLMDEYTHEQQELIKESIDIDLVLEEHTKESKDRTVEMSEKTERTEKEYKGGR